MFGRSTVQTLHTFNFQLRIICLLSCITIAAFHHACSIRVLVVAGFLFSFQIMSNFINNSYSIIIEICQYYFFKLGLLLQALARI